MGEWIKNAITDELPDTFRYFVAVERTRYREYSIFEHPSCP